MLVIGLTGGIASGKTTVSRLLREHGATVIDADIVGHEVYLPRTPAWQALIQTFGAELLGADEAIDRRKLGAIVFNNPEAMRKLTGIVWPQMKRVMSGLLDGHRRANVPVVVLEAAVLIEAGWQDLVDEIWTTVVSPEVAIARLMARNQMSEEQARARLASQISNEERVREANTIIDNSGSVAELAEHMDRLWLDVEHRAA
ncbi:MAG: dephospho-CoA kinase [Dehalococcoidia bacterium]